MHRSERRFQVHMLAKQVSRTYAMVSWSGSDFIHHLLNREILELPSTGFDFGRDLHIVFICRELNRSGCDWATIKSCLNDPVILDLVVNYLRETFASKHLVKRDYLANRIKFAAFGRDISQCEALAEIAA